MGVEERSFWSPAIRVGPVDSLGEGGVVGQPVTNGSKSLLTRVSIFPHSLVIPEPVIYCWDV